MLQYEKEAAKSSQSGLYLQKAGEKGELEGCRTPPAVLNHHFKFDCFWSIAKWKGIGFWYRDQRFESFYSSLVAGFSLAVKEEERNWE